MPIPILMPALSPTMTEGTVARWMKAVGDDVRAGDVIAEIETDKATMEVEAVDEGKLGKILVPEGTEEVAVNTPIALLLEEGEDAAALGEDAPAAAPKPAARPEAPKAAVPEAAPKPAPAPAPKSAAAPAPAAPRAAPAPAARDDSRIAASPLARRLAAQAGLDLAALKGSGPNGRIVKADIDAALTKGAPQRPAAARPGAPAPAAVALDGDAPFELQAPNGMRKVVARRMTESKQQVPHFYMTMDVEADALLAARAALNAQAKDGDFKLTVNDLIIKAAAVALMQVPAANASWGDDGIRRYTRADISVAVALPGGLVTPVVRGANLKGLRQISAEMKDLADRARTNKLKPEEYQGGTFTISNLGMYGVKHFEAVINQPQGAILAVGAAEPRPVVKDGAIKVATVMSLTLSVDHRAVDGATGAEYLAALKRLIEAPVAMLL
ncbi:MAG: pyruvate dehydrogenase complex dihydrolipoamide acetyltransferase [Alphaproteobacteria bacterium]